MLRNSKGITLIALVITIIVLIILAGVSVNLLMGDDGLINIAKKGRENYIAASENELKGLNDVIEFLEDYTGKIKPEIQYSASGYEGIYTGDARSITVNVTTEGATVEYSEDGETWTNEAPSYTNTGTYTVTYKITKDGYKTVVDTVTVVINKAEGGVTAPTAKILTYNGSEQELINPGNTTTGTIQYKLGDGEYSTQIPTATNAGTYSIYYKVVGNENYNDVAEAGPISVTISKANSSGTPPTAISGLIYTGSAQNLHTTGTDASGGTWMYKLSTESNWSTSIRTATEAGTYTINCKISGDSNHNDFNSENLTVTIAEQPSTRITYTNLNVGSIVTFEKGSYSDSFYIIENNGTNVKLLAVNCLELTGYTQVSSANATYTFFGSTTEYSTSNAKVCNDEYISRLQSRYGISIIEGRLMNYTEATNLKNAGRTTILYGEGSPMYYLSSKVNASYHWGVCGQWSGNEISWLPAADTQKTYGRIRPMFIIAISNLN